MRRGNEPGARACCWSLILAAAIIQFTVKMSGGELTALRERSPKAQRTGRSDGCHGSRPSRATERAGSGRSADVWGGLGGYVA